MIHFIYNKPSKYTPKMVLWVSVQFLNINFLIFFAFMSVCFENLVSQPSVPLISISLLLLVFDFLLRIYSSGMLVLNRNFVIDLVVIVSLCISFSLYNFKSQLVYLQIVALLKMWDVFRFNHLVYNLVKKDNFAFKFYVIMKIVYWIMLASQILGCLFYALDFYLIKN